MIRSFGPFRYPAGANGIASLVPVPTLPAAATNPGQNHPPHVDPLPVPAHRPTKVILTQTFANVANVV